MAQLVKNPPAMGRPGFDSWVGKIPWGKERLRTPVFWLGEFHELYSPWGGKESDTTERLSLLLSLVAQLVKNLPAMQETCVQSLGRKDSLEKGIATHSSTLAWRIPRTPEPGRLQYMGYKEPDTTEQLTHLDHF